MWWLPTKRNYTNSVWEKALYAFLYDPNTNVSLEIGLTGGNVIVKLAGPTFNTGEFIRPIVSMDFNTLMNEMDLLKILEFNINMEIQDQIIINKPILNFLMILLVFLIYL